jgi:hypothetical protein
MRSYSDGPTALIAGATGFVGRELVTYLSEKRRDVRIVALTRKPRVRSGATARLLSDCHARGWGLRRPILAVSRSRGCPSCVRRLQQRRRATPIRVQLHRRPPGDGHRAPRQALDAALVLPTGRRRARRDPLPTSPVICARPECRMSLCRQDVSFRACSTSRGRSGRGSPTSWPNRRVH